MRAVCGLDVHKDSVYLCILTGEGELIEKVFGVLTFRLQQMRDLLPAHNVDEVSMESTSVYRIPIWRVLAPHFHMRPVNPYFIKHRGKIGREKKAHMQSSWVALPRNFAYAPTFSG